MKKELKQTDFKMDRCWLCNRTKKEVKDFIATSPSVKEAVARVTDKEEDKDFLELICPLCCYVIKHTQTAAINRELLKQMDMVVKMVMERFGIIEPGYGG